MAKTKIKKTREEKLIQAKLRRRKKYEEIKNDPEKYAIQKEKEKNRYLKRKEQKKLKSVVDMTPREKRLQRKKWRENSKRYTEKKKTHRRIQQLLIDGTPPTSDREDNVDNALQVDPLEGPSRQSQLPEVGCKQCQKKTKLIRKLRYNYKKQISKLKQEKEKNDKERCAVKRMLTKMIKQNRIRQAQNEPSTEQKVDKLVDEIDHDKRDEIKKKLLFREIISRNLSEGFSGLKKKEKRGFSDIIMKNKENFKKHKMLGTTRKFTIRKQTIKDLKDVKFNMQQQIEDFFEDDSNTKISPDKKEFITRNGVKKQKRYLTDTLTNLHKKFINVRNSDVGYSTFCKYRPFWVLHPKESDRNTCACKIHVNFNLLTKSLKKNRVIEQANGTALLQTLCCDVYDERCLNRTCELCKGKVINILEFNNEEQIYYHEWCTKKENYTSKGQQKTKFINTKIKVLDYPKNVLLKLQKSLNVYFRHCANIVAQYKHLKTLKATLTPMEALVHLDFSENYSVKFNEEIQSFHFGGSRAQITLHTSVVYLINQDTGIMKPYNVCSISECNKHDAKAIWAHLIPLLSYIQEISPLIDTVHFISDSPSSQYRNKFMCYVIGQLHQDFPELKYITWNYLEAGHGKGPPDGVGGTLKRTADQVVRLGKDIGTIEEFLMQIRLNVKNIKLLSVSEHDVEEKKFPSEVQPFRGTMLVHQVLWAANNPQMTFRKLSCFFCDNGVICSHGYHLGFIDLPPAPDNDAVVLKDFLDKNTNGSLFREVINSLCPPDQTQQSQPLSRMAIDVIPNIQGSSRGVPENKAITVLSDVRLHWSNKSFTKTKTKRSNSRFQSDFERFVVGNRQEDEKNTTPFKRNIIKYNINKEETVEKETSENHCYIFNDCSDEDLIHKEGETRKAKENKRYENINKIINKMKENIKYNFFDSSDEDIF